jgi:alpha-beta hydrolase superfamily lysophospholipase
MRTRIRPTTAAAFVALTSCLALSIPQSALAQAPAPEGGGGGARFAQDPRAQTRTYHFEDTNEDLPYSIYVSTKVKPDQKAPAAFLMHPDTLASVKDAMPLFLTHGDADTVVPTDVGRRWAKEATELQMKDFNYLELPGADHGTVIAWSNA